MREKKKKKKVLRGSGRRAGRENGVWTRKSNIVEGL